MSTADAALACAHSLRIHRDRMGATIERLAGLGSSPLGFRAAGTAEDRRAAELAAQELEAAGLTGVAIEDVPVHGWSFRGARVEAGTSSYEAASMGGVPGTGAGGV